MPKLLVFGLGRVFERHHCPSIQANPDWRLVGACEPSDVRREWLAAQQLVLFIGSQAEEILAIEYQDSPEASCPSYQAHHQRGFPQSAQVRPDIGDMKGRSGCVGTTVAIRGRIIAIPGISGLKPHCTLGADIGSQPRPSFVIETTVKARASS